MTDYSSLLRDRVTLKCRCLDRIFLQGYVPKLQSVGQVCNFLYHQKGFNIPSSAAFGRIGEDYVKSIHRFAEENNIPVVRFEKGQNKEEFVRPYLEKAAEAGEDRVVLIGIAQEKASMWRSWKAKGQEKAPHPHMEWGATFWKTNAYAPYPIWLWLNGHEWAKRQLEKAGIGYESLDNGFLNCENPAALQKICDRLGSGAVKSFFWRWFHRLPSPFTEEDLRAGYVYALAFRQFEVSETCVFDRPQAGRMWFESVIRDHLDVGRPDQVMLIFDRRITRRTSARFRSRVLIRGVDPILNCYYKSSRIKQYFKEGRALRTETVICNTYDFGIGRLVCAKNWNALRAVGESANRRLCEAEAADALPIPDVHTFQQVSRPSTNEDGLYSPGLRFGDPRVMAILASLVGFCHLFVGFTNAQLTEQVCAISGDPYTRRQATYDLRRLKRKGLIVKIPGSRRYQLTLLGRRVAVLFTKVHMRVLAPGLTALDLTWPEQIQQRSFLARSWSNFEAALEKFIDRQIVAAA